MCRALRRGCWENPRNLTLYSPTIQREKAGIGGGTHQTRERSARNAANVECILPLRWAAKPRQPPHITVVQVVCIGVIDCCRKLAVAQGTSTVRLEQFCSKSCLFTFYCWRLQREMAGIVLFLTLTVNQVDHVVGSKLKSLCHDVSEWSRDTNRTEYTFIPRCPDRKCCSSRGFAFIAVTLALCSRVGMAQASHCSRT